jgi:hypothetical protein
MFAEFQGHPAVTATGRAYHQDYVVYLRARNGKIVLIREYFDAARWLRLFPDDRSVPPSLWKR